MQWHQPQRLGKESRNGAWRAKGFSFALGIGKSILVDKNQILESQEALPEEFFKGEKDVGDSSGAGKVPHRSLYTQCSFGRLGIRTFLCLTHSFWAQQG